MALLTADELALAGISPSSGSSSSYLNTREYYWSMTPRNFVDKSLSLYYVTSDGNLNGSMRSEQEYGIRPAISLSSDVTLLGGDGTKNNPFTISE